MPEMTAALQVNLAQRLSRTSANAQSTASVDGAGSTYVSDVTLRYVGMGVEEFAKEGRLSKQEFVTVTPKFWGRTNWYTKITIESSSLASGDNTLAATNVPVVSADANGITGASMAAYIASNLNAAIGTGSMTVTWSDDTWKFTIAEDTASNLTSISINPPSVDNYIDGTEKTFGRSGTDTGTSWTSNIPEDCTLETDLPSDFLEMEHVDYDDHILYQAPFDLFMSPETNSSWVEYYAIRDQKLYLTPTPNDRRMLKIRYRYTPTTATISGTQNTATCSLPTENHMAPVYYAAGMILRETFEPEEAEKMFGLYYDQVRKYRIRQANQNSKMFPRNVEFYVPRVESS